MSLFPMKYEVCSRCDMKGKEYARELLTGHGVPLDRDFHSLDWHTVDHILRSADAYGYRKPKNASGSRARMFYQFANR